MQRALVLKELLQETLNEWLADKALRMGAALAFYSVFSLAPLFLIAVSVASLMFGEEAANAQLSGELEQLVGEPGAKAIQDILRQSKTNGGSTWAAALGILTLVIGASGVFLELQDALNTIWKVAPKPDSTWLALVRDRVLSFTMVVTVGFLLQISLVVNTALAAISKYLTPASIPGGGTHLWDWANVLVSFAVITMLFALMYKVLPDVKVGWDNVWIGAVVTSLLFTLGKYLIGVYLGQGSATSAYGAAGSLVLVLLWVYYSALLFLFGAEFTRVYARRYGSAVVPADHAETITSGARAEQGLPPATPNLSDRPGQVPEPKVAPAT